MPKILSYSVCNFFKFQIQVSVQFYRKAKKIIIKMALDLPIELIRELSDFLSQHSWLFAFSNVRILLNLDSIPDHWADFMVETSVNQLKSVLAGEFPDYVPDFVRDFVRSRNSFVKKLERCVQKASQSVKRDELSNELKKGMSLKKQHEVSNLGHFLKDSLPKNDIIVDVGSGAGHLERFLIKTDGFPCKQFICIESSSAHIDSSVKWTKQEECMKPRTLHKTLKNEPDLLENLDKELSLRERSAALIGLHSCGDLSYAMLAWFAQSQSFQNLALVSCCYHKGSEFPQSETLLGMLKPCLRSHFALRLSCQDAFDKWKNQDEVKHAEHLKTFGLRALQEKVTDKLGDTVKKHNRHGIGKSVRRAKISDYLEKMFEVYSVKNGSDIGELKRRIAHEWNEEAFIWLEAFTGLQAFVQVLLEYIVLSDRVFYLRERKLNPVMYEIFDKETSPRNTLIFCSKPS